MERLKPFGFQLAIIRMTDEGKLIALSFRYVGPGNVDRDDDDE